MLVPVLVLAVALFRRFAWTRSQGKGMMDIGAVVGGGGGGGGDSGTQQQTQAFGSAYGLLADVATTLCPADILSLVCGALYPVAVGVNPPAWVEYGRPHPIPLIQSVSVPSAASPLIVLCHLSPASFLLGVLSSLAFGLHYL